MNWAIRLFTEIEWYTPCPHGVSLWLSLWPWTFPLLFLLLSYFSPLFLVLLPLLWVKCHAPPPPFTHCILSKITTHSIIVIPTINWPKMTILLSLNPQPLSLNTICPFINLSIYLYISLSSHLNLTITLTLSCLFTIYSHSLFSISLYYHSLL